MVQGRAPFISHGSVVPPRVFMNQSLAEVSSVPANVLKHDTGGDDYLKHDSGSNDYLVWE